jgi:hypothetical protein
MIKKKHQIWYENLIKLKNKGWNCKKKYNESRRELKIKGIAIIKIRIKFKKKLKSNDLRSN